MGRSNDYWLGYADGIRESDADVTDSAYADDVLVDLLEDIATNPSVVMPMDLREAVEHIARYWRDPTR